jgi:phosphopantetheinyl transferase
VPRSLQSATARDLLDVLLMEATGRAWTVSRDPDGRPHVEGGGPDVSLSHSAAWVSAAVVTRGRIGIDIEAHRPDRRDRSAIARRWFSAEEQSLVESGGDPALLACWTLREAFGKATGGGVAAALTVDGRLLLTAIGGAATAVIDGHRWALAQGGTRDFQAALAWRDGDTLHLADAVQAMLQRTTETSPSG